MNQAEAQFVQPAVETENVPRKIVVRGEVDGAFELVIEIGKCYGVTVSLERADSRTEKQRRSIFNGDVERFSLFPLKNTEGSAGVYFRENRERPGSANSKGDWDFDARP